MLTLVTLVVYWPITRHGFTNFDDDGYITGNSHVKSGLTWSGLVWAFENTETTNWHPLTWISHIVDCQLVVSVFSNAQTSPDQVSPDLGV